MAHPSSPKTPVSRAEKIRQRRNQQDLQRQNKATFAGGACKKASTKQNLSPAHRPHNTHSINANLNPVILTRRSFSKDSTKKSKERGVFSSRPLLERAHTKVRHKYTIPLNSTGAEIDLPSLPMIKIGWRLVSGTIAISCLAAILFYLTTPLFKISKVEIQGLERINPGDISAVLNLTNTPIYKIMPQEIEAKLEQNFPDLIDIAVVIVIPNRLVISAAERKPMVTWLNDEQVWFIDEEGVIFPSRGYAPNDTLVIKSSEMPPSPAPKPVMESFSIPWFLKFFSTHETSLIQVEQPVDDQIKPALEEMKLSHQADQTLIRSAQFLSTQVPEGTVLIYSSRDGLGWFDERGWNVFIGLKFENMDIKLAEYLATVSQLDEKGIQPSMISVEHIHSPFYRVD